jgi:hypothetical protein
LFRERLCLRAIHTAARMKTAMKTMKIVPMMANPIILGNLRGSHRTRA